MSAVAAAARALRERLSAMRAPIDLPEAHARAVAEAYATPPRHYHTIDHVGWVLDRFAEVERDVGWNAPREVALAIVYHDAVYVAGARDNEARSADLALREMAGAFGAGTHDTRRITELIRLTAAHGSLDPRSLDRDAALFLDCDMAILGADPDAYAGYSAGVHAEFTAVYPDAAYRAGRARFLEQLRASERIFASAYFHDRLDAAARANLERELHDLRARDASTREGTANPVR